MTTDYMQYFDQSCNLICCKCMGSQPVAALAALLMMTLAVTVAKSAVTVCMAHSILLTSQG